jgi:hypothetical protein
MNNNVKVTSGKVVFIDFGENDFSTVETPPGNWFYIGVESPESGRTLVVLPSDEMVSLMKSAECCRISQLHGRLVEFNDETKRYRVVK